MIIRIFHFWSFNMKFTTPKVCFMNFISNINTPFPLLLNGTGVGCQSYMMKETPKPQTIRIGHFVITDLDEFLITITAKYMQH